MMKKTIIDIAKKYPFIRKKIRGFIYFYKKLKYMKYYNKYKINEKMILFEAYGGRKYGCSPKAMYEYIVNDDNFKDYTFIWSFEKPSNYEMKSNTIVVKSKSSEYYKYLSMSKYWIVNSLIDPSIRKKKEQIYVQCWHGTPLKKLRYDIEIDGKTMNSKDEIRKRNDLDTKKIDYFISPSSYCSEKFTSAFNLKNLNKENILIEQGYPRNDYLINYHKSDIKKIKDYLCIPENKKVILYAPTFRDNQHTSGLGYTYKLNVDFDELKTKIEDEYIILFRTHYFVANKFDFNKYKDFIYDVSNYDDINDLYIISDLLITDYSSVFFDFANLKKPMIFYMYDLYEYKNNLRDFYVDLNELPGPIVENMEDLIFEIKNNNYKKYEKKYEKFNKKFNYLDDGLATKRVVDIIFNRGVE